MPLYTFRMYDVYRTIDAFNLADALKEADIKEGDEYELIEEEDFELCGW
jgi:hypothetical protein